MDKGIGKGTLAFGLVVAKGFAIGGTVDQLRIVSL